MELRRDRESETLPIFSSSYRSKHIPSRYLLPPLPASPLLSPLSPLNCPTQDWNTPAPQPQRALSDTRSLLIFCPFPFPEIDDQWMDRQEKQKPRQAKSSSRSSSSSSSSVSSTTIIKHLSFTCQEIRARSRNGWRVGASKLHTPLVDRGRTVQNDQSTGRSTNDVVRHTPWSIPRRKSNLLVAPPPRR